jgi:hypothetical protein
MCVLPKLFPPQIREMPLIHTSPQPMQEIETY